MRSRREAMSMLMRLSLPNARDHLSMVQVRKHPSASSMTRHYTPTQCACGGDKHPGAASCVSCYRQTRWNVRENPDTGCVEWQGRVNNKGYGKYSDSFAHRIAYEHAKGPIPVGLQIDHLCRNKRCVNPDHLEAVTPSENLRRAYPTCRRGHAWTPENTYSRPDSVGKRTCEECRRVRESRRRIERRRPIAGVHR